MTVLIRNADGEIKTFMESAAGVRLEPGESLEEIPAPFGVYAGRLRLLVDGRGGELAQVTAGSGEVAVQVECPGEASVALNINGMEEIVPLVDGKGTLLLSRAVPGKFIITPADRQTYCAAGEAVCIVEVRR